MALLLLHAAFFASQPDSFLMPVFSDYAGVSAFHDQNI